MNQQTRTFLQALWQGGKYAHFWTPDGEEEIGADGQPYRARVSLWVGVDNIPDIPSVWRDVELYFSVNSSGQKRGDRQKMHNDDVAALNCLFAEFDAKDFADGLIGALAHISQLQFQPSVIVASGGGYHAYWLLDAPYIVHTEDDRTRARLVQYAWVYEVGGDASVHDLARVLRVPGTKNHKYDPARPVEFVTCELDRRYKFGELEALVADRIQAMQEAEQVLVSAPGGAGLSLDDHELIEKAMNARTNGAQFSRLWAGQHDGDHSVADQALVNLLAFWTGKDEERMDRLFRQSGLYREKWERKDYRESTLQSAVRGVRNVYDPSRTNDTSEAVRAAQAAIGMSTAQTNGAGPKTASSPPLQSVFGAEYHQHVDLLNTLGYYFRQNELTGAVEVNGEVVAEGLGDEIYVKMREMGCKNRSLLEACYRTNARQNQYHPVQEYLESLTWDGGDWIALLAQHLPDIHPPIEYSDGTTKTALHAFLHRWLIGAVAKAYGQRDTSVQNAMLVLDGPQNAGKSSFVRWLASGLPSFYIEAPIVPDSKDCMANLMGKWIWEVGELGSTTRRADREALKHFLTQGGVTLRKPYERESITKPALASFIGTLNNETGFLTDITGNRRFMAVTLSGIDWGYTAIDVDRVWAQAVKLYQNGEQWWVTDEEARVRDQLHGQYEVEDPYESWILKLFNLDPTKLTESDWFLTTADITKDMQTAGVTGQTRAIQMGVAVTLKQMGIAKDTSVRPRGYRGIRRKPAISTIP